MFYSPASIKYINTCMTNTLNVPPVSSEMDVAILCGFVRGSCVLEGHAARLA
jgi:hypothetical protein